MFLASWIENDSKHSQKTYIFHIWNHFKNNNFFRIGSRKE